MANVSIVIISHSAKLGDGLVELLQTLTGGLVHIASASGLETDAGKEFGTDTTYLIEVIQSCPSDSEILIFFDIGSAYLSCDMALELLPEDVSNRVTIVDAPLVEGSIVAAVESSLGRSKESILQSAIKTRQTQKILQ